MTYRELHIKAIRLFNSDKITLGEYEEMTKPLDREIEQEPRWIPVSEKLPEPNRLVLCHITTGTTETYFLALWNDTLNAWEEGIGGYRLLENDLGYEVIEWMPLPKFYKSEIEPQGSEDNNGSNT